jgi:hypothetical protein
VEEQLLDVLRVGTCGVELVDEEVVFFEVFEEQLVVSAEVAHNEELGTSTISVTVDPEPVTNFVDSVH